jgi:glycosyltransferase involved in cell wall biosynthesis
MRLPVSLVIITLNEAEGIERAIRSAEFCDDVVVLDSGSTDATREIAEGCGARVFQEPWRGYRAQKARAVELARHDWILSLDGDEALSEDLQRELRGRLPQIVSGQGASAYEFPRLTYNLGRWIRYGGWYPDRQLRLFDRRQAEWRGGEHVHERVQGKAGTSWQCERIDAHLLHWPFPTHAEQVATNNRYSSLGAQELRARGQKFSIGKLVFKSWSKFIECYLLKRGFLDGLAGFVIAVGAAYSVFLKWIKLWELERSSKP